MNIIDYIPVGRNNAVSREMLSVATGLDDRTIRNMIHESRRESPILNMQDGRGYFLPDLNDSVEVDLLETYVRQENARLRNMIHESRRESPILNMQDGRGYFLPDLNDSVEVDLLETYVRQENARLKSIGWSLMGARRALKDVQVNGQRAVR